MSRLRTPKMKKFTLLFITFLLITGFVASGAPISVKAKLDSAYLLQGKLGMLHLEVVTAKDAKGSFPLLAPNERGYVTVCDDSIELRTSVISDTVDLGSGRCQVNYHVPVQGFDSGFYKLPELLFVAGRDSARSNPVRLKIIPVNVTANDTISPYADVVGPYNPKITDKLPDALVDYWWLWVLIIVVLGAGIFLFIKFRSKGENIFKKEKPQPTPYELAISELEVLKNRKLWENGMEREYFTRLTEILRNYLEGRFGINAMEMTSAQIVSKLAADPRAKDKRDYVREVLSMADFVKFAKVRPLPDDNIEAFTNALKFVKLTKPENSGVDDSDNAADKRAYNSEGKEDNR